MAEHHLRHGILLAQEGKLDEALLSYSEAIRCAPQNALIFFSRGRSFQALGQWQQARDDYIQAIRLQPDFVDALNNLGSILLTIGQCDLAIVFFGEAIRLQPENAMAHYNMALSLHAARRYLPAMRSHELVLRLAPDWAQAHHARGNTLKELGRLPDALFAYRRAVECKPDFWEARGNWMFVAQGCSHMSPMQVMDEAREYGRLLSAHAPGKYRSWSAPQGRGRLRVGFVSGDLRNHPVGYFMQTLVQHLDRQSFELCAFVTRDEEDAQTAKLKPYFANWESLNGLSDEAAAARVHQRGPQILFDLSGHTEGQRLGVFAHKPAPLQVSWLGYFGTTGLPEMDHVLGDPHLSPEGEQSHFTETLWNLPQSWLCFTPPEDAADWPVSALPAIRNAYVTFGCLGNLIKVNPEVIRLWAAVLRRVPSSRLLIKAKQLADEAVKDELIQQLGQEGIAPDRLMLEGPSNRAQYLRTYERVDMVLDTFPYPGGTTSAEALWMGVPVLTLKGHHFLSRLGESIAMNTHRPEWIAQGEEDFVQKAQTLAADISQLAQWRSQSRAHLRQTPLFQAKQFAENFAHTLHDMWAAHLDRLATANGPHAGKD